MSIDALEAALEHKLLRQLYSKDGAIQEWNSTTFYTNPTEVMFNGKRAFAIGVGNTPVTPESMCAERKE